MTSRYDLAALRAACLQADPDADTRYDAFERMGLAYGPAHRGLEELFIGDGQALARIVLPESVQAQQESYVLHPSTLDAALQAAIAFQVEAVGGLDNAALILPLALSSLEVFGPCRDNVWALIRRSAGSAEGDALEKFDIELCDDGGAVRARLGGFCARATAVSGAEEAVRTALLQLDWTAQPATGSVAVPTKHLVLLCGGDTTVEAVRTRLPEAECLTFESGHDIAQTYAAAAEALLQRLQSLGREPGQQLVQVVVPANGPAGLFAGLGGMLRTAHLEYPYITGQVITVEPGQNVAQTLWENRGSAATQIRYERGERQEAGWSEMAAPVLATAANPWRDHGVYLITGGAGGLGLIVAREIASRAKTPTLILTGRSQPTPAQQTIFSELEALGATVLYRALDVGERAAVHTVLRVAVESHGDLLGFIQSAGVMRDSFLLN